MAWTVGQIQNQVQVLTGNHNLSDRVVTWTNRVLMGLATKAPWNKQLQTETLGGFPKVTTVTGQWATWAPWATRDIINVHHIIYDTQGVLVRNALQDFYGNLHGRNASYSSEIPSHYAIPGWCSEAGQYMIPLLVVYPFYTTATNAFLVQYLAAPGKMTGAASTHWILDKYGKLVLAGVMRLAMLFLGNLQGYMLWQQVYAASLTDMIRNEEAIVASTPHMRGMVPSIVLRGGR
jgi:hypothetical protein